MAVTPEVLKVGQFGVELVRGSADTETDLQMLVRYSGPWAAISSIFTGRRLLPREITDSAIISHHLVYNCKIGEGDLNRIPSGLTERDQIFYSTLVVSIAKEYDLRVSETRKRIGIIPPYARGRFLSDFFEIIPPDKASRILYAAADPDLSQSTKEGRFYAATEGTDTQSLAVEAVVLLPKDARHEIFREMAKLDPRREGRANRFLSLIASDWFNRNSPTSGFSDIYANLTDSPDEVGERVLDTYQDLSECRKIIEQVINCKIK